MTGEPFSPVLPDVNEIDCFLLNLRGEPLRSREEGLSRDHFENAEEVQCTGNMAPVCSIRHDPAVQTGIVPLTLFGRRFGEQTPRDLVIGGVEHIVGAVL